MSNHRKALIVACDEYEQSGLSQLAAPGADAEALAGVLGDPGIGDFIVQVVHNDPAHVVQEQIENLLVEGRPEDLLLLHFSCHGLKSESGELFFAARNTRPDRLASTAIPAEFVQRGMRASRSRSIVLLLDCCYGGAFAQGVRVRAGGSANVLDSFIGGKLAGGRGRAVITASSAMEYAFEEDRLTGSRERRPSVFTRAVVDGLASGEADRDEDGWVSLDELYDYVFDKVREQNPNQTPCRDFEMQGDLYLARSRRRRIRPAPLPPDLDAAINDRNMYTRRGAVSELRLRLQSDNLAAAAGAWDALTELVNDVTYVAEDARAARLEAAVLPAETELSFGKLIQDSSPPHRTVHLLGPPIAHACKPEVSASWIKVKAIDDGFDVSVDTAQSGALKGRIIIRGPTGEAAVSVETDVIPSPRTSVGTAASPEFLMGASAPQPETETPTAQDLPASTPSAGRGKTGGGLRVLRPRLPGARIWLIATVAVALAIVAGALVLAAGPHKTVRGTSAMPPSVSASYSWSTLDPTGATYNKMLGINNNDHIVGYYSSYPAGFPSRGYDLLLPYGLHYVPISYRGAPYSQVTGLNENGVQLGLYWRAPKDVGHAFFWNNTLREPANLRPGCELLGVNDHDIAVGFCPQLHKNRFSYWYNISKNEMLGRLHGFGGTSVTAAAINNSKTVAGYFTDAKGLTRGFVLFRGKWRANLDVRRARVTEALGVNDAGEIVGFYQLGNGIRHGFTWTRQRGFSTVDDRNGFGHTTISGINARGCLAGYYVGKDRHTHGMLVIPRPVESVGTATLAPVVSVGEESLCSG